MPAYAPLQRPIGYHWNVSDKETRKREAVMKLAERYFTADEYLELMKDMAAGRVDVRIYDDGIVLTRKF